MKTMRVRFVLLSMLAIASIANAGQAGPVKFKNVHFMPNGVVIAYVEGARSNAPACATESIRFAVNGTTPGGKLQVAGLLTAYTSGKAVAIYGTGTCTAWGDTETIDFFLTLD